MGPHLAQKLKSLGLSRVAELRRFTAAELERLLGSMGRKLAETAWGRDESPIAPLQERKSISAEETLTHDASGPAELIPRLAAQALRVARRLRQKGLKARTITLKLKHSDFRLITRAKTLPQATADTRLIFRTAAELLAAHGGRGEFRLIGLGLSGLEPAGRGQPELFRDFDGLKERRRLDEAVDDIIGRFGPRAIGLAVALNDD